MHYLDKLLANLACQFICGKKRLQYFTILKSFSYWRFWNITVYFSLFASLLSESIPSPKKQFTRTNDKNIILKNFKLLQNDLETAIIFSQPPLTL